MTVSHKCAISDLTFEIFIFNNLNLVSDKFYIKSHNWLYLTNQIDYMSQIQLYISECYFTFHNFNFLKLWFCLTNYVTLCLYFPLRYVRLKPQEQFFTNSIMSNNITLSYWIAICFYYSSWVTSILKQIVFKYFSCCFSGIFCQHIWIGLLIYFFTSCFWKKNLIIL